MLFNAYRFFRRRWYFRPTRAVYRRLRGTKAPEAGLKEQRADAFPRLELRARSAALETYTFDLQQAVVYPAADIGEVDVLFWRARRSRRTNTMACTAEGNPMTVCGHVCR